MGINVGYLGFGAFGNCTSLTGVYFEGDAPIADFAEGTAFMGATNATVYYLPGTSYWGTTLGGRPTALWLRP